jgi:hypothetical protein
MRILLDEKAAADWLGLRPPTLATWRCKRQGPDYCKIGGAVRYPLKNLEAFVAANMVAHND